MESTFTNYNGKTEIPKLISLSSGFVSIIFCCSARQDLSFCLCKDELDDRFDCGEVQVANFTWLYIVLLVAPQASSKWKTFK